MDAKHPQTMRPKVSLIRFGAVPDTAGTTTFRRALNQEILDLIRSLPLSMHTDAIVFFMQHMGASLIPAFDLFCNYYPPAWSILYWIEQREPPVTSLTSEDRRCAKTAHAMALLLHPLDDHLNDGQLPASHLTLLLRSQAWRCMHAALTALAVGVPDGDALVQGFLNDYYASIASPPVIASLEGYSTHFRNQMATGMIVPVLMACKRFADECFTAALKRAYGSFGIAWRLLDDLQDIESDRISGSRSAVYYCLPEGLRSQWALTADDISRQGGDRIADFIETHDVGDKIRAQVIRELNSAANISEEYGMRGLAAELRALARPLLH